MVKGNCHEASKRKKVCSARPWANLSKKAKKRGRSTVSGPPLGTNERMIYNALAPANARDTMAFEKCGRDLEKAANLQEIKI